MSSDSVRSPSGCFGYFNARVRYDAHRPLRYFGIALMDNALGVFTFCRMLEGNVTARSCSHVAL